MDQAQVSARLVAKVVLVAAAVVAALYFAYLIRDVIGLILIAAFFAVAIAPAVNWLDQRRVPRWLAILLVYLSIAAGIFGIGLLIVPPLVNGVEDLSADLPGYVGRPAQQRDLPRLRRPLPDHREADRAGGAAAQPAG